MKLISEEAINDWWVDVRSSEVDGNISNSNNLLYKMSTSSTVGSIDTDKVKHKSINDSPRKRKSGGILARAKTIELKPLRTPPKLWFLCHS
jgi:hypothetical protein